MPTKPERPKPVVYKAFCRFFFSNMPHLGITSRKIATRAPAASCKKITQQSPNRINDAEMTRSEHSTMKYLITFPRFTRLSFFRATGPQIQMSCLICNAATHPFHKYRILDAEMGRQLLDDEATGTQMYALLYFTNVQQHSSVGHSARSDRPFGFQTMESDLVDGYRDFP